MILFVAVNLYHTRIRKNLEAATFSQGVTLLVQLCGVPIFLRCWGAAGYGEWLTLSALASFLYLADLGYSAVSATEMRILVERGDRANALQVFQTNFVVATLLSLVAFSLLAALTNGPALALWLLSLHVLLSLQTGLLHDVYRSEGAQFRGVFWNNCMRLAEFFIVMGVATLHRRIAAAAAMMLVCRFVAYLWMLGDVRQRYRWFSLGTTHFRISRLKRLVRPSLSFVIFPLCQRAIDSGTITFIGSFLGPVPVVLFSTARTLANFTIQISNVIKNAVWPEMSAAFAADDIASVRSMHGRAFQVSLILTTLACILIGTLGVPIYSAWTHKILLLNQPVFLALLLGAIAGSAWNISLLVPLSTNRHAQVALFYLMVTALSFAVLYISRSGLLGVAMIRAFAELVMVGVVVPRALKVVGGLPNKAPWQTPPGSLRTVSPYSR